MSRLAPPLAALAALGAILAAPPLSAQLAGRQSLNLDGARRVIAAAETAAHRANAAGVIAVVDDGGNLMAVERLDGTFAAGAHISIGKARTAVLFKRPTRAFEQIIHDGRTAMVALEDFTPLQGGIPIVVDGQVVGGVGVSGAASAQQDEELALAGAAAIAPPAAGTSATSATNGEGGARAQPAAAPVIPVSYWSGAQVASSFARGAVLYDGAGARNYMVHTSRRDQAGQVEVHTRDTDIIYVLEGSATFVTGGTVVDGRTTEPDEIRGTRVTGGESRRITKGDVVIVPNGTPHWFQAVDGPLSYYTVKVR
jgi:glc operon protein GlcG